MVSIGGSDVGLPHAALLGVGFANRLWKCRTPHKYGGKGVLWRKERGSVRTWMSSGRSSLNSHLLVTSFAAGKSQPPWRHDSLERADSDRFF